jgi:hypothetical protein
MFESPPIYDSPPSQEESEDRWSVNTSSKIESSRATTPKESYRALDELSDAPKPVFFKNLIPPPMPILKKTPKAKLHYSEVRIEHAYEKAFLSLPEFEGEERDHPLESKEAEDEGEGKNSIPFVEAKEEDILVQKVFMEEKMNPEKKEGDVRDIYSYAAGVSGHSLRQYFNVEFKVFEPGQVNPIVYS